MGLKAIIQNEVNWDFNRKEFTTIEDYSAYEGMKLYNSIHSGEEDFEPLFIEYVQIGQILSRLKWEEIGICVGSVEFMREVFNQLGVEEPVLDYPEELNKYLGKPIEKMAYNELLRKYEGKEMFVKPVETKQFTGGVFQIREDSLNIIIGNNIDKENDLLYVANNISDLHSEWRVYIHNQKIKHIAPYLGFTYNLGKNKEEFNLDMDSIYRMIKDFKSQPISYSLDVAIRGFYDRWEGADDLETILIEVNDGWALGNYGIDPYDYFLMLLGRWKEILKNNDKGN